MRLGSFRGEEDFLIYKIYKQPTNGLQIYDVILFTICSPACFGR